MALTYLLINVFIIAVPLVLTFDKRTVYYRQIPAVAFSIGVVSTFYLIWDVIVTARGEWSFNSKYLTGVQLLNIPLEEMLFFLTVPYSCSVHLRDGFICDQKPRCENADSRL